MGCGAITCNLPGVMAAPGALAPAGSALVWVPFGYLLSRPMDLLGPVCLFGAYLPGTDERSYAWPHETRLLIKVY